MDISHFNRGANIVPAEGAFAITPSDGSDLSFVTRAIYVGVSGNISVTMANGDNVVFSNLLGGLLYPLQIRRVKSSSTTASGLVGLY